MLNTSKGKEKYKDLICWARSTDLLSITICINKILIFYNIFPSTWQICSTQISKQISKWHLEKLLSKGAKFEQSLPVFFCLFMPRTVHKKLFLKHKIPWVMRFKNHYSTCIIYIQKKKRELINNTSNQW